MKQLIEPKVDILTHKQDRSGFDQDRLGQGRSCRNRLFKADITGNEKSGQVI